MRLTRHLVAFLGFSMLLHIASPSAAQTPPRPVTRVVVLGVNHAAQLVSENDQPGMLAAYIEKVGPSAICVERAPEPYARGSHYEFTYEIQDVVLPYARQKHIEIIPFDWEPSYEDQMLGWGLLLSEPPEIRAKEGFQGFLSFPKPGALRRGLFEADKRASLAEVDAWIRNPSEHASLDLSRRMYLYRTFMQARRIAAAARGRSGQTLLVVVGEFHKYDIEAILADDNTIQIVQPSTLGLPAPKDAERLTSRGNRIAIASFNLLGVQAETGNVNWAWLGRVLDELEREEVSPETALLRTRYALLTKQIDAATAIERYQAVVADTHSRTAFTWNGVRDRSRVDSYFDPFGNLRVDQRARLEMAREQYRLGDVENADFELSTLRSDLSDRKSLQLEAYWRRYLTARRQGSSRP